MGRRFGLPIAGGAPGTSVDFEGLVGGVRVGPLEGRATTTAGLARSVEVVLKTPTVYNDSAAVEVAYQLRDAAAPDLRSSSLGASSWSSC